MVDDRVFVSASLDFWENFAAVVESLPYSRGDLVDDCPEAKLLDEYLLEIVPRIEQAKQTCLKF